MGNYQLKAIEAMQVPVPLEHEAAKDLEARFAKLCAWLDEKGMTEIDFTLPQGDRPARVMFNDGTPYAVQEGSWLIWNSEMLRFLIMHNEMFVSLYEEV